MAENALVEIDLEYGRTVVAALDDEQDPSMRPTAALWFLFADEDTWRLLLALPAMASNPPQVVYNRLIDILNRRVQGEISVDRVGLMPRRITLSHC
ncbi:MAG: hypothetical protein H0T61_12735 [Actinobacteria bacterium]|nr:hypothetical protein [Actinomycetota bacterium]